jgi:hypothetical protein
MALIALMTTGIFFLVTNHMHAFTRILWTGRLNRRETTRAKRAVNTSGKAGAQVPHPPWR